MKKRFQFKRDKSRNMDVTGERGDKDFIFESESSKRWNVMVFFCASFAALFALAIFFSGLGLYFNPVMPKLEMKVADEFNVIAPSESRAAALPDPSEQDVSFFQKKVTYNKDVYAFYVNWDSNSEQSLKEHSDEIDVLVPQWLRLNEDLGVESEIDPDIVKFANEKGMKITPLLHNIQDGKWSRERVSALLNSPGERAKLISNLHALIKKNGFDGINIDFENLDRSDRDELTQFMRELYGVFHADGLTVSMDVAAANPAYDYRQLEKHVDRLIVMAYDENVDSPGPIASNAWFKSILEKLPKDKLIVALGNYGYDWEWESQEPGEAVSFDDITRLAGKAGLNIQWDDISQNPYVKYTKNGEVHEVWFLDSATFYNQLKLSEEAGAKGIALWRLGAEDPSVWDILKGNKLENMQTVKNGGNIFSKGQGNIYRASESREEGRRSFSFDKQGFITNESYISNPRAYEFERLSKANGKEIVLTFDDGPTPEYTEKILKILKEQGIPATFFLIGKNAALHQDIVKQMVKDGHEVGSHTFTHPNTKNLSKEKLKFELNGAQRVIQGITGHTTLLYRSPLGDEEAKYFPEHFERMKNVTEMGYITVNYDVDSRDWELRDKDAIVDKVLKQASGGDIILLHDGGGDRQATVEALPIIIEQLKSKGYTFTTVGELIGQNKNNVMPAVADVEKPIVHSSKLVLWGAAHFKTITVGLLIGFMLVLALRLLVLGFLAIKHKKQVVRRQVSQGESFTPLVSVVIPAYNEERVIKKTIESIMDSDYPNLEIIVVDDGSKDGTSLTVEGNFSEHDNVRLVRKKNGGKASALNEGTKKANGEILVVVDADTSVTRETISMLVGHFEDGAMAAVSGNVRVGNRRNLLTVWQHIEYVTGFNIEKRAFATQNCLTVVPGAIGAWRKQVVEKLGYFSDDTLAEDTDMTLKILRGGYKVTIEEKALAYTEAPKTLRDFLKQRFRWTFGTLQCFWKHKQAFAGREHKTLGFLAMPNMLLFQFVVPFFAPVIDVLFIWKLATGEVGTSLLIFGTYFLIDLIVSLVAFRFEKLSVKPLMTVILQRIVYRYLLLWVTWKSLMVALKGTRVGWGKLKRSGDLAPERGFFG
ncbi:polysaccharide deacetylase family protein [Bacillus sp. FJAT-27245]|uniref:polysaccharide deacetylase family protein n=1 Tax=Bacillus sp. FJAT-27245 TaxID=1684144 RepID=UPI0006A7D0B9|nr:polysaccharide deacetylase family protein [Bacillus sp. FJAT-27245]